MCSIKIFKMLHFFVVNKRKTQLKKNKKQGKIFKIVPLPESLCTSENFCPR